MDLGRVRASRRGIAGLAAALVAGPLIVVAAVASPAQALSAGPAVAQPVAGTPVLIGGVLIGASAARIPDTVPTFVRPHVVAPKALGAHGSRGGVS